MFWPRDSLKFGADYLINLCLLKSCLFRGGHQHPMTYGDKTTSQLTFSERSSAPSAHSLVLRPKLIVTGAATYPLGTRSKSIHSKHIMYISYSVVALTYGITNSSVWGSQTPSVQAQRLGFSSFHSWQMQRDSAVTPTVSIKQTLAQLPCLVK